MTTRRQLAPATQRQAEQVVGFSQSSFGGMTKDVPTTEVNDKFSFRNVNCVDYGQYFEGRVGTRRYNDAGNTGIDYATYPLLGRHFNRINNTIYSHCGSKVYAHDVNFENMVEVVKCSSDSLGSTPSMFDDFESDTLLFSDGIWKIVSNDGSPYMVKVNCSNPEITKQMLQSNFDLSHAQNSGSTNSYRYITSYSRFLGNDATNTRQSDVQIFETGTCLELSNISSTLSFREVWTINAIKTLLVNIYNDNTQNPCLKYLAVPKERIDVTHYSIYRTKNIGYDSGNNPAQYTWVDDIPVLGIISSLTELDTRIIGNIVTPIGPEFRQKKRATVNVYGEHKFRVDSVDKKKIFFIDLFTGYPDPGNFIVSNAGVNVEFDYVPEPPDMHAPHFFVKTNVDIVDPFTAYYFNPNIPVKLEDIPNDDNATQTSLDVTKFVYGNGNVCAGYLNISDNSLSNIRNFALTNSLIGTTISVRTPPTNSIITLTSIIDDNSFNYTGTVGGSNFYTEILSNTGLAWAFVDDTSKTVTMPGGLFTAADVGKTVFGENGYMNVISEIISPVKVKLLNPIESTGYMNMTWIGSQDLFMSYLDSTVDDGKSLEEEGLQERILANNTLYYPLYAYRSMDACDVGAVTNGMLFTGKRGSSVVQYTAIGDKPHQAGAYRNDEQTENLHANISTFLKQAGMLSIICTDRVMANDLTQPMSNIGVAAFGEYIPKINPFNQTDMRIGCRHWRTLVPVAPGKWMGVTSEPAIRIFDGKSWSKDNYAALGGVSAIMDDLRSVGPCDLMAAYSDRDGYLLFGERYTDSELVFPEEIIVESLITGDFLDIGGTHTDQTSFISYLDVGGVRP